MANATSNLIVETAGDTAAQVIYVPVKGSTHLYKGTVLAQHSGGYFTAYSASGAGVGAGVAQHEVDNSAGADGDKRVAIEIHRIICLANGTSGDAFADTDAIGTVVYGTDDHTAAKTSDTQARKVLGFFMGFETDGKVRVLIDPRLARIVNALQGVADAPASADALRESIVALFG
jgi:hypothetical protein